MEIKNILNQVTLDEFGKPQGIFAINKPVGMTSHDVVNRIRRRLNTKKVGHAGALDPFANGIVLILVGNHTKLSDQLMLAKKEYIGRFLFGLSTDTQDTEGKITEAKSVELSEDALKSALKSFENGYEQFVSIYSSVKVNGKKLRDLARKSKKFEITEKDGKRIVSFEMNDRIEEVELPKKMIEIFNIELLEIKKILASELEFRYEKDLNFVYADIKLEVSKGTYIRQFAEDLGKYLNLPAMLIQLKRTKIEDIGLDDTKEIDDISL